MVLWAVLQLESGSNREAHMEGLQAALSRIDQIQSTIAAQTQAMEAPDFGAAMDQALQSPPGDLCPGQPPQDEMDSLMPGQNGMSPVLMQMLQGQSPATALMSPLSVSPLAQSNSVSCGQTSVAMAVNALTGKNLRDVDINARYGFGLLNALNGETGAQGFQWRDAGEVGPYAWPLIDQKVNTEHTPVIVALNGPEFSPSGHGHIVTIVKTEGDTVTYADPASGQMKTTTKQRMNEAPRHPDGNFVFVADRMGLSTKAVLPASNAGWFGITPAGPGG